MACVHEEVPRPQGRCAKTHATKLRLAALATFLIIAGVALGVGIQFALQKGEYWRQKDCLGFVPVDQHRAV
jgi:hypothetical protein